MRLLALLQLIACSSALLPLSSAPRTAPLSRRAALSALPLAAAPLAAALPLTAMPLAATAEAECASRDDLECLEKRKAEAMEKNFSNPGGFLGVAVLLVLRGYNRQRVDKQRRDAGQGPLPGFGSVQRKKE